MAEGDRAAIETTLAYEDETAGRLMQREVLAAPQFWTVGQTIDHVRKDPATTCRSCSSTSMWSIRPTRPSAPLPVSHLLRTERETPLAQIMEPVTEITVDMDQEEVAYIFDKYHLITRPGRSRPAAGWWARSPSTTSSASSRKRPRRTSWPWPGVSDAGRDADVVDIVKARLPWLLLNLVTAAIAVSGIGRVPGRDRQAGRPGHPDADRRVAGRQRRHPDPGRGRARPGQQAS